MNPSISKLRGFTLLEVMLVLVVMGLAVSYVVVNANLTSQEDELERHAKRFQVVFDMAADFAVLNQRQLGVRIDIKENQYSFMVLDEEQLWQPFEDDKVFAAYTLPDDFKMTLSLDDLPWIEDDSLFSDGVFDETLSLDEDEVEIGNEEDNPPPPPQILLLSSGDTTPFSLVIAYEPQFGSDDPVYFRLQGNDTPPLEREGPLDIL